MPKDQWFIEQSARVDEELRLNAWLANHRDRLKLRHGIYQPHLSVKPILIIVGITAAIVLAFLRGYYG